MKKFLGKIRKKITSSDSSKEEITKRSQLQDVPPAPDGLTVQAPSVSAPSPTKKEIPIPDNMLPEAEIKVDKVTEPESSKNLPSPNDTPQEIKCPHCNKMLKDEFDFCPYCGKSVKLVCSKCEKQLEEAFEFCPYCGEEVKK
jgi:RNA polymerase subunit RPABC4/transcription elongation factor Spt4